MNDTYKEGKDINMGTLDKIQPYEIEKARKIVRQYRFEGFLSSARDYIISELKKEIEEIEGYEVYSYDLRYVDPHFRRDGKTVYRGLLEVTFLSIERELYILRY